MTDETSVPFGSEITEGLEIDGVGIVYNDQLTTADKVKVAQENLLKRGKGKAIVVYASEK